MKALMLCALLLWFCSGCANVRVAITIPDAQQPTRNITISVFNERL